MKALYDVPAPAKLNLFLHVTGRRPDGMHLLQSVFMLIDWCDTLHFELRPGGALSREDLERPLPADDLVLRAARALQAASGTAHGAHISIEKRLPEQAGHGRRLVRRGQLPAGAQPALGTGPVAAALAQIGLQLGADVPFFLGRAQRLGRRDRGAARRRWRCRRPGLRWSSPLKDWARRPSSVIRS